MRSTIALLALALAACGNVQDQPPGADGPTTPTADADPASPDAEPTPGADAVTCTAGEFVACDDASTARSCNATGDGFVTTSCGAPGCNASAGRCNECVPSSIACDGDVVESCDADGLALPDETCALSCVDGPTAHCAYLSPKYLPDVCDALATEPTFTIGTVTSFDTNLDVACTGGIITQSGAASICVVRADTITISSTMTVTGGRELALVADGDLTVTSGATLDVSANGTTGGPGSGRVSGAIAGHGNAGGNGGGGAGFGQLGSNGGSTVDGSGGAGGTTFDPLAITGMIGGAHPTNPTVLLGVYGGGGGGALSLISCRGTVAMAGLIDAGGGGGGGGFDSIAGIGSDIFGGAGGGSGGYVVIQGLGVSVTGKLYANGGGGGGGAGDDDSGVDKSGFAGGDGRRSSTQVASGGTTQTTAAGRGGDGGIGAAAPTVGRGHGNFGSGGGGGGSVGHFQIYVPTGVTPTVSPIEVSPQFDPDLTRPTR